MNQLQQLKNLGTIIVADTGNINEISFLKPQDATTNPSLILKAIEDGRYDYLLNNIIDLDLKSSLIDININFGTEILKHIPGSISTEIDPRLSYNTRSTIDAARRIIKLYQQRGIPKSRVLIKIAATWEGIQAAKKLEKDGVRCNMTLIFSMVQAQACAEAGVTLISPFVGRIYDWYNANEIPYEIDPGVESVVEINDYYKRHNYSTIVMGASFRNTSQITELGGCDRLTISPKLIKELKNCNDKIESRIKKDCEKAVKKPEQVNRYSFLSRMIEDRMADEKLEEGIHKFIEDTVKLEKLIEIKKETHRFLNPILKKVRFE